MTVNELIMILWEDSVRPSPSWKWTSETGYEKPARIRSVGWRVHETDDAVTIAPNISSTHSDGDNQTCGELVIPKRSIVKLATIEAPIDEHGNTYMSGESAKKIPEIVRVDTGIGPYGWCNECAVMIPSNGGRCPHID